MKIASGTKAATDFLEKLKSSGDLLDVYSDEWLSKQNERSELPPHFIAAIDEEYGLDYRNHLLVLYINHDKREVIKELTNLYSPLQKLVEGKHHPDFAFLNLATKQMLCVGLGRKNRLFAYDPAIDHRLDIYGLTGLGNAQYIQAFTALDHGEVVETIITALYSIGVALFEHDSQPSDHTEVYGMLQDVPDSNGLYYFPNEADGVTRQELEEIDATYERTSESMANALAKLTQFFPEIYIGEINTGDY